MEIWKEEFDECQKEQKHQYYGLNSLSHETGFSMKHTKRKITTEGFALSVPGSSKHYWGDKKNGSFLSNTLF